MYIDAQHVFSDAQALTATADATNVLDLESDRNIGIGEPMAVVIQLDVVADDANADETYVVDIETDTVAAMSSPVDLGTITITRGDVAGTKYVFFIPADGTAQQFLRLEYTLGGTTPSVTITSFLIPASMIQNEQEFAGGFTVTG